MVENSAVYKQIHAALLEDDVTCALSLISNDDVDIDYRDVTHDLQTMLMKVCYIELNISSFQMFLGAVFDKDPDVNIQDSWGRTFIMHACIANKPCIIEALLRHERTDVTVIDYDGNSALSYAVQNCDLFTLEDLLQHDDGPSLLLKQNNKGQSPYTIAEKSGNKEIMNLFDSFVVRSQDLEEKRCRKYGSRDVNQLPPTYATTPRDVIVTPRAMNISDAPFNRNNSKNDVRFKENKRGRLQMTKGQLSLHAMREFSDASEPLVKCDSAPVTRTRHDWPDRAEFKTSLSLTSPRLSRRHHKQDCLLSESMPLNKTLPSMNTFRDSQNSLSSDSHIPECNIRRQRRPSISLPDLRSMAGCLINSGSSTPTSEYDRPFNKQKYDSSNEDEVFEQRNQNEYDSNASKYHKENERDKQVTLPKIRTGKINMTSHSKNSFGISPLARQRKYSTSDDQLHRAVLVQNRT